MITDLSSILPSSGSTTLDEIYSERARIRKERESNEVYQRLHQIECDYEYAIRILASKIDVLEKKLSEGEAGASDHS